MARNSEYPLDITWDEQDFAREKKRKKKVVFGMLSVAAIVIGAAFLFQPAQTKEVQIEPLVLPAPVIVPRREVKVKSKYCQILEDLYKRSAVNLTIQKELTRVCGLSN